MSRPHLHPVPMTMFLTLSTLLTSCADYDPSGEKAFWKDRAQAEQDDRAREQQLNAQYQSTMQAREAELDHALTTSGMQTEAPTWLIGSPEGNAYAHCMIQGAAVYVGTVRVGEWLDNVGPRLCMSEDVKVDAKYGEKADEVFRRFVRAQILPAGPPKG